MNARLTAALITIAGLFASPVLADKDGKGGGGSSSSGSSGKGGSSTSTSSDKASSGSAASDRPPQTDAQRRHPRPGTGTGHRGGGGHGYGGGHGGYYGGRYGYGYGNGYGWYPYSYWGYTPYYSSGYYGYSPYSGYYGYSPYSYAARRPRYSRQQNGSLRVIVEPNKTRVYVDGYYAGVADDFDGLLQRLYLPSGRHDISLKLDGYRTQHFRVYVPFDQTVKIHHDMIEGEGETTTEAYTGLPHDADVKGRPRDDDDEGWDGDRDRDRDWDRDDDGDRDNRGGGTVRLDISPRDATVYVNGEFHGSARERLRLPPGRHRIEVVRPGFRTVEREIEVRRDRSSEVRIELVRM